MDRELIKPVERERPQRVQVRDHRCENCAAYEAPLGGAGECRAEVPKIIQVMAPTGVSLSGRWPPVLPSQWCMQWVRG